MGNFKTFLNESISFDNLLNYIIEGTGFSVTDFLKDAPSQRNKKFFAQRQSEGKTGSILKDVIWDEESDSLTLKYRVVPTFDNKVGTVTKNTSFKTNKEYHVEIQFEDVEKFLGSKEDFFSVLTKKEQDELFKILVKEGTVKVHSDAYDWYWQGGWENASKLKYSIYPFTGTKGKGIWSKRHKNSSTAIYITKHIMEALKTIPFVSNKVVKLLRDNYQE